MRNLRVIGVDVFLEKRKTRMPVGTLTRAEGNFVFTYNERYFRAKRILPLGPEFPLTERQFISQDLFPSFEDRIPLRRNPAYPDYCIAMGISPEEKDPLVLLSTIGRRGPSWFIFFPLYDRSITAEEVVKFRKSLGLTTREFAAVFEFSQSSLNALERNRILGSEILKRLEILLCFPDVALHFLVLNGGHLLHDKLVKARQELRALQCK